MYNSRAVAGLCVGVAATILSQHVAAQSNASKTTAAPVPVISVSADAALKEMGAFIGATERFTFSAAITFDHVLASGQKVQATAREDVALDRQNGFYVEWSGDFGDRQLWYDGKSLTIYDPDTPFYSTESATARDLDSALDTLLAKADVAPPLADFLYGDPYKSLRTNLQYGFPLGTSDIGGRTCRSFAFVEKDIDWQIWIETGPQPLPCKLTITYKDQPAQPQFSAVFTDWDLAPRLAASAFTPDLPQGAEKIPFKNIATTSGK
jgi:hypothetical protein